MSSNGKNGTVTRGGSAMPPLEQVFKGRRILVTGATGFLGKVFLAMLLRWHPEIEKIYLLIRGDRRSSVGRYRREILDSPAMAPVRAHLSAEFDDVASLRIARCKLQTTICIHIDAAEKVHGRSHVARPQPPFPQLH